MGYIAPVAVPGVTPPSAPGDIQNGVGTASLKPPFIPAPKCAKVELRFTVDSQPSECVLYFYTGVAAPTITDMENVGNAVLTAWETSMVPIFPSNVITTGYRASDMSSRTGPVAELTLEPTIPGTATGTPTTGENCIGIGLHTGLKGRSQNGRTFLPVCLEAAFVASVPTDAARTSTLNAFRDFVGGLNGEGYTFVLVSFMTNKLWRNTAQVTTIAILSVGQWIYTQRRRLPGHNRHR